MAKDKKNDPTKLKPGELLELINGTDLGAVITYERLRRLRQFAGKRGGKNGRIHLVKFLSFVLQAKHDQVLVKQRRTAGVRSYDQHKAQEAARNKAASLAHRDITPLPAVKDPERRESCKTDLKRYCEIYHPETFTLAWSDDHLRVIGKMQNAILYGGLSAIAMPRGNGKTSLVEAAAEWSILYGHQSFVVIVGSDETAAKQNLESIKTEIETNGKLLEDFPEVCYPVRMLEGINNRASGQLLDGVRTRIGWTANEVQFPTIEGSVSSGSLIRVAGITGRIRGMKHKAADGRTLRPTFVIPDDPQTDESARSLSQNQNRLRILNGAILGLSGPNEKISGIMPCTVIAPGDMADEILDQDKHPEWNGERTKLVYEFPANKTLWAEYAEIRGESFRQHGDIRLATEFYKENRMQMDEGAVIAWEQRFEHDELSAIQYAMNLLLRDERSFWSEYQNEPMPDANMAEEQLEADFVAQKLNGRARGIPAVGTTKATMFTDVQGKVLYWVICGFNEEFGGDVLDYGTWPEQPSRDYRLNAVTKTMESELIAGGRSGGAEAQIYNALNCLMQEKLTQAFVDVGGAEIHISRSVIDANWHVSTDVVYKFCQDSEFAGILMPSHGSGITAAKRPMSQLPKKKGDRVGLEWKSPQPGTRRGIRHVNYDTNFWKTFTRNRFLVEIGDPGCLSLFGSKQLTHDHFAQQCSAEYSIKTQGRGRTVEEWACRPNRDNHFFDCLVGNHMAASMEGIKLGELQRAGDTIGRAKTKGNWADRQKAKKAENQARRST